MSPAARLPGTMPLDASSPLFAATAWVLPVLLAITLHEAAHAYAADLCGDDTARRHGRVSLDPRRHVDPFGTVLLPGLLLLMHAPFLFGYARPVPVDQRALRHPRRDMVLVAAAGPASNLLQAVAAALLLGPVSRVEGLDWVAANLARAVAVNLGLAVFNLLPIPPLDGAHIAIGLLPRRWSRSLQTAMPYGMALLIGLVVVLPTVGDALGIDLDVVGILVGRVLQALLHGLDRWLG